MPDRRYERRRQRLVDQLRARGLTDERVLEAIGRVPRHRFVEEGLRGRAYADEALPIGRGQTISQPFTVAYQTSLLELGPDEPRVLEVGTGSGYQAAVLCEMGARVFSIERHEPLLERAKATLDDLGYRVRTRCGDGSQGWPGYAPFDAIVVTAGAQAVPDPLVKQLRPPPETEAPEADTSEADGSGRDAERGGRLVIPVGDTGGQEMRRLTRTGPDPEDVAVETFHSFRFVPLVREA
jgi:protein-L-isoaspartate(D-aspartate) O-methyltransferase